jgi:16S rRNA (cytosine967-C5)-methyltransferase
MDLSSLGPLQRALLNAAADATRPGGVIAYVTCSPHLAETEFVVGDVVGKRDDLVVEDARVLLPDVEDLEDGPFVRLWPHRHGTDGMFLAVLRKR